MSKRRRIVRFVTPRHGTDVQAAKIRLAPERGIHTARVGIWIGLATLLWSLIAIPTFGI